MNHARYSANRIRITTLVLSVLLVGLGYVGLFHTQAIYAYGFPALLTVCLIGMKWAAPVIPMKELVVLVVLIFALSSLANWAGAEYSAYPVIYLADKVVAAVCFLGFGAHWVRRGYIPAAANRWNG
ncbi:hypothetical protein [Stenotrophomonas bentonitica]